MQIADFTITRFQFARDRVIGDSQVRIATANYAALELHSKDGKTGLGFAASLFEPLPALVDQPPAALIHRVARPRGGNQRRMTVPFEEAINQALWDLAAQEVGLPLWRYLGGTDPRTRVYASGLDFHLSDATYVAFFGAAKAQGYRGFKIKV